MSRHSRIARTAVAILLLLVLQVGLSNIAHARSPQQFTPLPGPNVTWVVPDPSFEPLPGARALFGTFHGGAYRIEVPDNWNGELVIYAHGVDVAIPKELSLDDPPIREELVSEGFAWAIASFRNNGYVPGIGAQDSLSLKGLFDDLVGTPKRVYLYGQSLGAHSTMISAEFFPEAYDGYFTECGVAGGYDLFDFFTASAAAAEFITGANFEQGGAAETGKILAKLGTFPDFTPEGRELADAMINLSGGPRPFAFQGLETYMLFDIGIGANAFVARAASPISMAATDTNAVFKLDPGFALTSAQLNAGVRRVAADPSFRNPFGPYAELAPMTGQIERPMMQIAGTGDMFVPISEEQHYLALTKAAGTSNLLVQRAIRSAGHCNYTTAERVRAFNDLVNWVHTGVRPAGDDLSGDLTDAGLQFTDPLRPGDPGTRASVP